MARRDFAVALLDGRCVVGRRNGPGEGWSIYVCPPDGEGLILGYSMPALWPTRCEQPDCPAMTLAKRSAAPAGDPAGVAQPEG